MITKIPKPRKPDQHGFLPLVITLVLTILAILVLIFLRLKHVQTNTASL